MHFMLMLWWTLGPKPFAGSPVVDPPHILLSPTAMAQMIKNVQLARKYKWVNAKTFIKVLASKYKVPPKDSRIVWRFIMTAHEFRCGQKRCIDINSGQLHVKLAL